MAIKLKNIVPWGRCLEEYTDMFLLSPSDMKKKIIGVGDGPASFNFEAAQLGYCVTSVDPIYQFSKREIQSRIDETYKTIIHQLKENQDQYIWEKIKDPDDLGRIRLDSMTVFLKDYEKGLTENRYVYGMMPKLKFNNKHFEIALASHFLLLYSEQLDLQFHIDSINELMRVAEEARIFPIVELNGTKSRHLKNILTHFNNSFDLSIIKTRYHFQKGANEMLVIKK